VWLREFLAAVYQLGLWAERSTSAPWSGLPHSHQRKKLRFAQRGAEWEPPTVMPTAFRGRDVADATNLSVAKRRPRGTCGKGGSLTACASTSRAFAKSMKTGRRRSRIPVIQRAPCTGGGRQFWASEVLATAGRGHAGTFAAGDTLPPLDGFLQGVRIRSKVGMGNFRLMPSPA